MTKYQIFSSWNYPKFHIFTKVLIFKYHWKKIDPLLLPSGAFKEKGPVRLRSLQCGPSVVFFPDVKCIFPVGISILVDPKQISVDSKSEEQKKKKSPLKVLCHSATSTCYATGAFWWPSSCLRDFFFSFSFFFFFFFVGALRTIFQGGLSAAADTADS